MSALPLLTIRAAALVSALALAVLSTSLPAQMPDPHSKVNVPFAFQVGSTHFSPGTYVVSSPAEHLLCVQDGKRSVMTLSLYEANAKPAAVSKVIFHRYGNQYFLSEVWTSGKVDHLYCPPSKAEKEASGSQIGGERASVPNHTSVEIALLELPR